MITTNKCFLIELFFLLLGLKYVNKPGVYINFKFIFLSLQNNLCFYLAMLE